MLKYYYCKVKLQNLIQLPNRVLKRSEYPNVIKVFKVKGFTVGTPRKTPVTQTTLQTVAVF